MEKTHTPANDRNPEVAMTEKPNTMTAEEAEGTIAEMIEIREQEAEEGYSILDVLLDYFPEQIDLVIFEDGHTEPFDDFLVRKCNEYCSPLDPIK